MSRFIRVLSLLAMLLCAVTVAGEPLSRNAQILGIVRSKTFDPPFDSHMKAELNALVPILKQTKPDSEVLIEAFYPEIKGKSREYQVSMAFSLAEQVQYYLKSKQSLDRNFFVAIWENQDESSKFPGIRITTYTRDYFEN